MSREEVEDDEKQALRDEVGKLDTLLTESSQAIRLLQDKLYSEQDTNEKLMNHLEESEGSLQILSEENAALKQDAFDLNLKVLELRKEIARTTFKGMHIKSSLSDPLDAASELMSTLAAQKVEMAEHGTTIFRIQESLMKSAKSLAEEVCDQIVQSDQYLEELMIRYPAVEFEAKEQPDPYQSIAGWQSNRKPRMSSASSSNNNSSSATGTHLLHPHQHAPASAHNDLPIQDLHSNSSSPIITSNGDGGTGYLYGSPSQRFPLFSSSGNYHPDSDNATSSTSNGNDNDSSLLSVSDAPHTPPHTSAATTSSSGATSSLPAPVAPAAATPLLSHQMSPLFAALAAGPSDVTLSSHKFKQSHASNHSSWCGEEEEEEEEEEERRERIEFNSNNNSDTVKCKEGEDDNRSMSPDSIELSSPQVDVGNPEVEVESGATETVLQSQDIEHMQQEEDFYESAF